MKILCKNKNWKINKEYDLNKILYLLIDHPNIIYINCFVWKNNKNQYHRDYDFPAFVYNNGCVIWYINDKLHRDNNKSALLKQK